MLKTIQDYDRLREAISRLNSDEEKKVKRVLAQTDRFYLLRDLLSTKNWKHPEKPDLPFFQNQWLLDRCREAMLVSDSSLRIISRFHGKTTIETFGGTIQDLLREPNLTQGIFAITKLIAEGFGFQIMAELETNEELKALFPDVLYRDPSSESDRWSLMHGFNVKRSGAFTTSSVEVWGLIGSNFTGKRFGRIRYDDIINEQAVTNPGQIERATRQWGLSLATGIPGLTKRTGIGTFYAYADTYHEIIRRGWDLTLHSAYEINYEDSEFDDVTGLPLRLEVNKNKPVLYSKEFLQRLEREMGPELFGIQLLCDPNAAEVRGMSAEWLRTYKEPINRVWKGKNIYIVYDPATSKEDRWANYTAMWVVAAGPDQKLYLVGGIRDRMNLKEQMDVLFALVRLFMPIQHVRVERYGFNAVIEAIRAMQEALSFRFPILETKDRARKEDRIERLVPYLHAGRVLAPSGMPYRTVAGEEIDLVECLKTEMREWPTGRYNDQLDALSQLVLPDFPIVWPRSSSDRQGDLSVHDYMLRALSVRHDAIGDEISWMGM